MTPVDIPAPLAGPVIAAITIAVAYLATIDWTHPNHNDQEQ
jgi:hypothetical protein